MCRCTPEIRTPWCGKTGCEWPIQSGETAETVMNQKVFSEIKFPINEDIYAVNIAVKELLQDGWKLSHFSKENIVLNRMWEI